MNKTLIAAAVALACTASGAAFAEDAAPASPHTFTANVGVVSDYLFRGISQTHGEPAIQGGVDYSHSSGLYVGTWLSSISWVSDAQSRSVPTEIDVYAGFKNTFGSSDFGYDVGYITYNYPGSKDTPSNFSAKANTQEVYGALSWKWLSAKYSYATSSHFVGWYGGSAGGDVNQGTKGSNYLELNAAYDLGNGWGVSAHIGHQKVKHYQAQGNTDASYSDWNIGGTKDIGFGVLGLKYSDTNTKGDCPAAGGTAPTVNAYCWGAFGSSDFKNVSKGKLVASFSKSF